MSDLLDAAAAYIEWGWHLFPLVPGSKRPAIPAHTADKCDGSDPYCAEGHLGWEQRASHDRNDILASWASGRHGIAIATGPSRLLVVDIDISKSSGEATGMASLARLEANSGHRVPTRTFTVATPSGGSHRYFKLTDDQAKMATTTTGRLGIGLDTRGRGGYVVAAPTTLGSTGGYRVSCPLPPAPVPRWLIQLLLPEHRASHETPRRAARPRSTVRHLDRYLQAAIDGETERVVTAAVGQRNLTLFLASIALGQLVGGQLLDESEAIEILRHAARSQAELPGDGFDQRQADATIRSGLARGVSEPRQVANRI